MVNNIPRPSLALDPNHGDKSSALKDSKRATMIEGKVFDKDNSKPILGQITDMSDSNNQEMSLSTARGNPKRDSFKSSVHGQSSTAHK